MVTWTSNLPVFLPKLTASVEAVRKEVAKLAHDSIVNGSPLTGAPGQPEDLRQGQFVIAETGTDTTTVGTNDHSALAVEDGISHFNGAPIHLHSAVGGFHGTKLTHQNAGALIDQVVSRVRKDSA